MFSNNWPALDQWLVVNGTIIFAILETKCQILCIRFGVNVLLVHGHQRRDYATKVIEGISAQIFNFSKIFLFIVCIQYILTNTVTNLPESFGGSQVTITCSAGKVIPSTGQSTQLYTCQSGTGSGGTWSPTPQNCL